MPRHIYRHADLVPLIAGIRALDSMSITLDIEIKAVAEAFAVLAEAADVPMPLRKYYAKVEKKLSAAKIGWKQKLDPKQLGIWGRLCGMDLYVRTRSTLGLMKLNDEELERLHHVNNRLLELEKSLKQMTNGMRERLDGFSSSGVEWDPYDGIQIKLWLRIGPDPERPSYDPDVWDESGLMEPLEICVNILEHWQSKTTEDEDPWGLDDGQDHSELSGREGHPLQNIHQSYLFHEFYDHAEVGAWGMLNLQALWIEVISHRSGDFQI